MFLAVDPANGVPIYAQIVRQVTFAIAAGALVPGELVPSVREAAVALAVNPNTVARAYRELQSAGVLANVRGMGLAVTKTASKRCREERRRIVRARLKDVLLEARQSRLSEREIKKLVELAFADSKREKVP